MCSYYNIHRITVTELQLGPNKVSGAKELVAATERIPSQGTSLRVPLAIWRVARMRHFRMPLMICATAQ